jgi:rod shape-determining protein MreC
MVVDYRGASLMPMRTALKMLLFPVQYTVDLPYRAASFTQEFFSEHDKISTQNRELRTLINVYAARDQKYFSIAKENQRLRSQLDAVPAVREKFTLAEILSVSADPFRQNVVINKGANEGLFVGQVALAGKNIYGQVDSVTPNSAVITRLTDVKHAIPVRNIRTGEGALATGTGKINLLELKHIEAKKDVQKNDVYVSSGLGQLFPADFPVAIVRNVAYNPGDSLMKVKAEPLADFTKTREILLIWRSDYADYANNAIDGGKDKKREVVAKTLKNKKGKQSKSNKGQKIKKKGNKKKNIKNKKVKHKKARN